MTCVGVLVGWILKLKPPPGFVGSLSVLLCFRIDQRMHILGSHHSAHRVTLDKSLGLSGPQILYSKVEL